MKLLRLLWHEIHQLVAALIIHLPESILGQVARKHYWKFILKENIGPFFSIQQGAIVDSQGSLRIGKNFILADHAYMSASNSKGIWIGDYVGIARNSYVRSANHRFDDLEKPIMLQGHEFKTILFQGNEYSIVIEDDVWIAANVVILSGAHIGKGSVIGAGSVVGSVIPPYSIVLGNPGRRIRSRTSSSAPSLDF